MTPSAPKQGGFNGGVVLAVATCRKLLRRGLTRQNGDAGAQLHLSAPKLLFLRG